MKFPLVRRQEFDSMKRRLIRLESETGAIQREFQKRVLHADVQRIADLLVEIGESVEVYYEPRKEGEEWYVGYADPHGSDLPVHEHFGDLIGGLTWLSRNGKMMLESRGR